MRKLLFVLLLTLGAVVACGQTPEKYETITLHNGQKVKGQITEYAAMDHVVILTDDGRVLRYEWSEIDRIQRRDRPDKGAYSQDFNGKGPQRGYRAMVDVEYTVGMGTYGLNRYGVSTTHGWQLKPWLFMGAGVTYLRYSNTGVDERKRQYNTFAAYGDLRSEWLKSSYTPYFDLRAGYNFKKNLGFFINPSIGFRVGMSRNNPDLALNISAGYVYQRMKPYVHTGNTMGRYGFVTFVPDDEYPTIEVEGMHNCGGFTLRLGFEF